MSINRELLMAVLCLVLIGKVVVDGKVLSTQKYELEQAADALILIFDGAVVVRKHRETGDIRVDLPYNPAWHIGDSEPGILFKGVCSPEMVL